MKLHYKLIGICLGIALLLPSKVGYARYASPHAKIPTPARLQRHPQITDEVCLAVTLMNEAGNQSHKGQMLVAAVVLNRAKHNKQTVCQVIRQKGQFSWYRGEHSIVLNERSISFLPTSRQILLDNKHGKFVNYSGKNIMWFHTKSVRPFWRKSVKVAVVEGSHIFYYKGA